MGSGTGNDIVDSPDRLAHNRQSGGVVGVGVHHRATAAIRVGSVEAQMQAAFAGGLAFSLHHISIQIQDHNILRGNIKIVDTGGRNRHQAGLPVIDADIASRAMAQSRRAHFPAIFRDQRSFTFHSHMITTFAHAFSL